MRMGDYNQPEDGFSSNEQVQDIQTILTVKNAKGNEERSFACDLIISKIQPPQEIKKKQYSLEPDIITGWAPKMIMPKPVRLIFENIFIEETIKQALLHPQINKLCYLGPRFNTTYSAWKVLNVPFPYNYLNQQRITLTDRIFVGMNPRLKQQSLIFDSMFQSGNLDAVFKIQDYEYNCFMRVDANTKGHLQWYYFKISNICPNQKYKLNIYNFQKAKTLYTRGMKPYIFSAKKCQVNKIGWHQSCAQVTYIKNNPVLQGELTDKQNNKGIYDKEGKYFKLSFILQTEYQNDTIEIAYCPPYTYTQLNQFISNLVIKSSHRNIITEDFLCISLGGLKLPLLTITNNADQQHSLFKKGGRCKNKKLIFVMGRVHPGQCNGSFMVQGFIRWLCNNSQESEELRQRYIFKILPMANPDGVIIGNYRTGLSGKDFNRQFINPDSQLFVQVYELKKYLQKCKNIYCNDFNLFMDFHGHTVKKNVFTYGPQFIISDTRYYQSKLLPKLIGRRTPLFRFYSCIFKITPSKQSTARAVLLKQLKIPFAYTIQASNGSYYSHEEMKDIAFNIETWGEIGQKIGESLYDYWLMFKMLRSKKQQRNKQKQKTKLKKDKNKRIHSSLLRSSHHNNLQISSRYKSSLSNLKFKTTHQQDMLKQIYEEITNQNQIHVQKCSDDQYSQGRSDSQSQNNDLPQNQIENIICSNRVEEKTINCHPQKRNHVKILKALKKPSAVEEIEQQLVVQKDQKIFQITREKVKIRKKVQSISGTPSPVKQTQPNNTAKIINISFALNPIPTLSTLQEERIKKMKTQLYQSKFQSRKINKLEQFDSYRKTYLSLQKQGIKREQIKRKFNMNNTFSNGPKYKIQEVVGRRIFTETAI